jgi:hypothetical protein
MGTQHRVHLGTRGQKMAHHPLAQHGAAGAGDPDYQSFHDDLQAIMIEES